MKINFVRTFYSVSFSALLIFSGCSALAPIEQAKTTKSPYGDNVTVTTTTLEDGSTVETITVNSPVTAGSPSTSSLYPTNKITIGFPDTSDVTYFPVSMLSYYTARIQKDNETFEYSCHGGEVLTTKELDSGNWTVTLEGFSKDGTSLTNQTTAEVSIPSYSTTIPAALKMRKNLENLDELFAAKIADAKDGETIYAAGEIDVKEAIVITDNLTIKNIEGRTLKFTRNANLADALFTITATEDNPDYMPELCLGGSKSGQLIIDGSSETIESNSSLIIAAYAKLTIDNNTVIQNNNNINTKSSGGGISSLYSSLTIKGNVEISGNSTVMYGGGIFAQGSFIDCDKSTSLVIKNNKAKFHGGGIAANFGSNMVLNNTYILSNTANYENQTETAYAGGGIYFNPDSNDETVFKGALLITNSVISGNKITAGYGGGIYSGKNSVLQLGTEDGLSPVLIGTDSTYTEPNTAQAGGGLYYRGLKGFIYSDTIIGNTLTTTSSENDCGNKASLGGGIYAACLTTDEQNVLTIYGAKICRNYASSQGGGIEILSAKLILSGGEINYNYSGSIGGGININKPADGIPFTSTFIMNGGIIANNTATTGAGGVYNAGTASLNAGTIENNTGTYSKNLYTLSSATTEISPNFSLQTN